MQGAAEPSVDPPRKKTVRFRWLRRLLRGCVSAVRWFLIFILGLWCALALYYSNLPGALRPLVAAVFVVTSIVVLFFVKPRGYGRFAFFVLVSAVIIYWLLIPPSHNRAWRKDVAVLPYANVKGNLITVHNIRNFD